MVAILATIIALGLGVPAGYALARFEFRRMKNRDLTIWFLSQRVLPPVVVLIPFLIMRTLHLLDSVWALVLVNATFVLPFAVVIMRQTFQELPPELEKLLKLTGLGFHEFLENFSSFSCSHFGSGSSNLCSIYLERISLCPVFNHTQG